MDFKIHQVYKMREDIQSLILSNQVDGFSQQQNDNARKKIQNMCINIPENYKYQRSNENNAVNIYSINQKNQKNTIDKNQNLKRCLEIINEKKVDYLFVTSNQEQKHSFKYKNANIVGIVFKENVQNRLFRSSNLIRFNLLERRFQKVQCVSLVKEIMVKLNNEKTHFKIKSQDEKIVKDNWKMFKNIINHMFSDDLTAIPVINQQNELLGVLRQQRIQYFPRFRNGFFYLDECFFFQTSKNKEIINQLEDEKQKYCQKIRDFQEIKCLFSLDQKQYSELIQCKFKLQFTQKRIKVLEGLDSEKFQLRNNKFLKSFCNEKEYSSLCRYQLELTILNQQIQYQRNRIRFQAFYKIFDKIYVERYVKRQEERHKSDQILGLLINKFLNIRRNYEKLVFSMIKHSQILFNKSLHFNRQQTNSINKFNQKSQSLESSRSSKDNKQSFNRYNSQHNHSNNLQKKQFQNENEMIQRQFKRKNSTQQKTLDQFQNDQRSGAVEIQTYNKESSSTISTTSKSQRQDQFSDQSGSVYHQNLKKHKLNQNSQTNEANLVNNQIQQLTQLKYSKSQQLNGQKQSEIDKLDKWQPNSSNLYQSVALSSSFSSKQLLEQRSKVQIQLNQVINKRQSILIQIRQLQEMIDKLPQFTQEQEKQFTAKYQSYQFQLKSLRIKHQSLLKRLQAILLPKQYKILNDIEN